MTIYDHNNYLKHFLVSGCFAQCYESIKNDQFNIVVAFLDNQLDVAAGSRLHSKPDSERMVIFFT